MHRTGDRLPSGLYRCIWCGERVRLGAEHCVLPLCPNCGCSGFEPFVLRRREVAAHREQRSRSLEAPSTGSWLGVPDESFFN